MIIIILAYLTIVFLHPSRHKAGAIISAILIGILKGLGEDTMKDYLRKR